MSILFSLVLFFCLPYYLPGLCYQIYYVIDLFSASAVSSRVCYVTKLFLQGFHCFIICLLRYCPVRGFDSSIFYLLRHSILGLSLTGFHRFIICFLRHYSVLGLSCLLRVSIVSLFACYVTALFSDSIVPSSVCCVTILKHSLEGAISDKNVIPWNIRCCRRKTLPLPGYVIVIVISKLLKRYSKAKRTRAPAYSRALRRIKGGFSKWGQEKLRSYFQNTRREQSSC